MNARWWIVVAMTVFLGVPSASIAAQARTVEIAVTTKGFEPAHVKVTKGEPLKLVVTRKTEETCAKEIVIPDANLKADLPLNKPVTLSFTPKRSGEIKYACGMNMITGVLEVASREATGDDQTTQGDMMGDGGMMGGSMQDMRAIHGLLSEHQKIRRSVKGIPSGVETVTTSEDAQVANLIREHVSQMKARIEEGRPIRQMDPLFRAIFENHQHIHLKVADVPGGVRVTETADSPNVVPLVRQHARRAVSEFVAEGMSRAMQPTPLPPGYAATKGQNERRAGRPHGCRCMGST